MRRRAQQQPAAAVMPARLEREPAGGPGDFRGWLEWTRERKDWRKAHGMDPLRTLLTWAAEMRPAHEAAAARWQAPGLLVEREARDSLSDR